MPTQTTNTNLSVNQPVYFGRTHGEKTLGTIVRFCRGSRGMIVVRQEEARGSFTSHPIGTLWKVAASFISPAPAGSVPTRSATAPTAKALFGRSDAEIIRDIGRIYGQLSPENLTCDGELSRSQVAARRRVLNAKLQALFTEIGRTVDESECWKL